MICYEKSSLNAAAVAAQSVAANAFVSFPINNLLTGVAIKHPAGSSSVSLIRGLYLVSVNADVVPAAAGNVGLQLLRKAHLLLLMVRKALLLALLTQL